MDDAVPVSMCDGKSLLDIIESPNAYKYYAELQEFSGVIKWKRDNCILVTRFDLVREVMSYGEVYSSSSGVLFQTDQNADGLALPLFLMEPPYHTRARKLAARAFSKRQNSKNYAMYLELSKELLVSNTASDNTLDIVSDYAVEVAISCLLGLVGILDSSLYDKIAMHMRAMVDPTFKSCLSGEEILISQATLKQAVLDNISEAKINPKDDFISCIANAGSNGDSLNDDEMISLIYLGIFGGFEDIIRLVASSIEILGDQPEMLQRLKCSDRNTLNRFVDESIRYGSSTHVMRRTSLVDHYLNGLKIKKGDKVVALIAGANRDSRAFVNPNQFDIDRKNSKQAITFGHGPHVCIGRHIAKEIISASIQAFIENIYSVEIRSELGTRYFNNNICGYVKLPASLVWDTAAIAEVIGGA